MQKKIQKIFFHLEIYAFELVALKTPLTDREYLSSGVNMLTNSLKISDTTKTEFFELVFFQSDQKIWENYRQADLSCVSDPLTCWLSRSFLTQGFFGIYVTPLFGVYNSRNKRLRRLIFFFKIFKILCRFRKSRKEFRKYFLVWR